MSAVLMRSGRHKPLCAGDFRESAVRHKLCYSRCQGESERESGQRKGFRADRSDLRLRHHRAAVRHRRSAAVAGEEFRGRRVRHWFAAIDQQRPADVRAHLRQRFLRAQADLSRCSALRQPGAVSDAEPDGFGHSEPLGLRHDHGRDTLRGRTGNLQRPGGRRSCSRLQNGRRSDRAGQPSILLIERERQHLRAHRAALSVDAGSRRAARRRRASLTKELAASARFWAKIGLSL